MVEKPLHGLLTPRTSPFVSAPDHHSDLSAAGHKLHSRYTPPRSWDASSSSSNSSCRTACLSRQAYSSSCRSTPFSCSTSSPDVTIPSVESSESSDTAWATSFMTPEMTPSASLASSNDLHDFALFPEPDIWAGAFLILDMAGSADSQLCTPGKFNLRITILKSLSG